MKKTGANVSAAVAEHSVGSPSGVYGGIDIGALYIDMLCERFKNRGIKTGLSEEKSAEIRRNARLLGLEVDSISGDDQKYRTLIEDGKAYMSSDDFAAYYKDLRGYKLPSYTTRAENEYKEAQTAKGTQESGKSSKKALWLAIIRRIKGGISDFFSVFVIEEFRNRSEEGVVEGEKKKLPRGILSTMLLVLLSLLMIVSSSVMVSRASGEVSDLEYEIEVLKEAKRDLDGKLIENTDMLEIKKIAVDELGMISRDYALSKYIDIREAEKIVIFDEKEESESMFTLIFKAIGFIGD